MNAILLICLTLLPTLVLGQQIGPYSATVSSFQADSRISCAVTTEGLLLCFGFQNYMQSYGNPRTNGAFIGNAYNFNKTAHQFSELPRSSGFSQIDLGVGRTVKEVSSGLNHTCAILDNDKLKCFGGNHHGQLGLGTSKPFIGDEAGDMGNNLPYVNLGTGRTVKKLGTGIAHTCVVLDNDKLKCFGSNSDGQLGLGDTASRGSQLDQTGDGLPYVDFGDQLVTDLSVNADITCVILDNNDLKCFGQNIHGALGQGLSEPMAGHNNETLPAKLSAVNLGTNLVAKKVGVGAVHVCVVVTGGRLKCFGMGSFLGLGMPVNNFGDDPSEMGDALPFVDLGTNRTVKEVSADSSHTCVILDDDSLKCFGAGRFRELGYPDRIFVGTIESRDMGDNLPAVNLGYNRKAKAVSTGSVATCVVLDNSLVKCFGFSSLHGIGVRYTADSGYLIGDDLPYVYLPRRGALAVQVDAFDHTCAVLESGRLKCFGNNSHGQLGFGKAGEDYGDAQGEMGSDLPFALQGTNSVLQVATGLEHTCALLAGGEVTCFGSNEYGQLGLEEVSSWGTQLDQPDEELLFVDLGTGNKAVSISAGKYHTCVLLESEKAKCFGRNEDGQLGLGVDVPAVGRTAGDMGDNLPYVDGGSNITSVYAGHLHTCIVDTASRMKCFGSNDSGQLGYGDKLPRGTSAATIGPNLPFVDLGTGEVRVSQVSAGRRHTCALINDAEVKCFGKDGLTGHAFGDSVTGDSLPFVKLPDWLEGTVTQVAAAEEHTCLLLRERQLLWCFGPGFTAGDSSTVHVSGHPVTQVVAQSKHTCALDVNGGVKCVGSNNRGQLGQESKEVSVLEPTETVRLGSICAHGTVKQVTPSNQEVLCVPCDAGTFQLLGENKCTACPEGYFCEFTIGDPVPCPVDSYSKGNGTECIPCEEGEYQPAVGSTECWSCPDGDCEIIPETDPPSVPQTCSGLEILNEEEGACELNSTSVILVVLGSLSALVLVGIISKRATTSKGSSNIV